MCREILLIRPYQYSKGSKENAVGWQKITDNLNENLENFNVLTKAIRDHFNLLISKRKTKKNEEDRASGISVEEKEIDVLLDEILDDINDCKEVLANKNEAKKRVDDQEKEKGAEMRLRAMETFGESQKRKNEDGDDISPPRQKRRNGTETFAFLTERNEIAREQHAEEVRMRKEEIEIRKQEAENSKQTFAIMVQNMQMQMQQQQMNQQFQLQQQQIQQQAQMFAALMEKLNK